MVGTTETGNETSTGAAPRLGKIARTAGETGKSVGKSVGKAGVTLAKPVARSLQKQSPDTLAKMLLAAVAPRLVDGIIRFAIRNPKTLLVGGAIAWFAVSRMDDDQSAAS